MNLYCNVKVRVFEKCWIVARGGLEYNISYRNTYRRDFGISIGKFQVEKN